MTNQQFATDWSLLGLDFYFSLFLGLTESSAVILLWFIQCHYKNQSLLVAQRWATVMTLPSLTSYKPLARHDILIDLRN